VVKAFYALKAQHLLKEPLEKALNAPEPFVGAGALWVDVCAATGKSPPLRKLLALPLDKPLGRGAVVQYLQWLNYRAGKSHRSERRSALMRIKAKAKDWLQTDNLAWIEFASALSANGLSSATRTWIKDWRSRTGLRSHYHKLFEIFCALGMDQEAIEIGEEAIRREDHNRKYWAKLQVAWLQVNAGRADLAAPWLEDLQKEEKVAPLRGFIASVKSVAEAKPERRSELAREAVRSAKAVYLGKLLSKSSPFVKRQMRRSVAFLADSGAGFGARFWVAMASRGLI